MLEMFPKVGVVGWRSYLMLQKLSLRLKKLPEVGEVT